MAGPRETLVTIPVTEYEELRERDRFLTHLENAGLVLPTADFEETMREQGEAWPDFVDGSP